MAATSRECVVQRATGYTVMSNYHLRDANLRLEDVGLLSKILSLPEDWDYTIAGLAKICGCGKDKIRKSLQSLEKAGYISRSRVRAEDGTLGGTQYIIRETPEQSAQPMSGFPTQVKPTQAEPTLENPTELNTKEELITKGINPPVSPEKPKAERKARKPKTNTQLDDTQTEELIRQNVATLGDVSGWGRDDKNAVYKLAMEFYQPRDCGGQPPRHTTRGINGLFRRLSEYSRGDAQAVRGLLNEAIERGWTSVYPEKGAKPGAPVPVRNSGSVEEWT